MTLGYLLARAGVEVVVLEKHSDFLRDFRGDTLHPSTLEVMTELGLDTDLLALPHQQLPRMRGYIGDRQVTLADFSRLPVRHRFIAMMPQWDFLNFLATKAADYSTFRLQMETEAESLVERDGIVVGLKARSGGQDLEIEADLVVGADGRNSVLRDQAGLDRRDLDAPVDVLWFRLSRQPDDPDDAFGRVGRGRVFVLLNRGTHWQCAYVIPKGGLPRTQSVGLDAFRHAVAEAAPFASARVHEIRSWDDVALLSVRVERLRRWYKHGLLFIGDAAHAMSPIGGVGINLAIQDAVAAANVLARPLREHRVQPKDLRRVQRRRAAPTRLTQAAQVQIQNRGLRPALGSGSQHPPLMARLLAQILRLPADQRLNGRLVGLGVRPEHVRSEVIGPANVSDR